MASNTKRQSELVAEVTKKFDKVKNVHQLRQTQMWLNLAFFLGKQYVAPVVQTYGDGSVVRVLKERPKPSWRVRLVANRTFGIVQTRLAKVLKNKPRIVFTPAAEDVRCVQTARAANHLARFLEQPFKLNMSVKNEEAWLWAIIMGTSYYHPFWNTELGQPLPGVDGKYTGDVDLDVIAPFELMVDPLDRTFEMNDAKWCVRTRMSSVEEIEEMYGEKVGPERSTPWNTMEYTLYELMKGRIISDVTKAGDAEYAQVQEYWEVPMKKNGWKGKHFIFAGADKRVVWEAEADKETGKVFEDRRIPFYRIIDVRVPGRPDGESIVTHVVPLQREFNATHSSIIEHRKLLLKGKILVPKECQVHPDAFTDEPGERIEYQGLSGLTPLIVRPPEIAVSLFKIIEYLIQEIQEVSGLHEVSRAQIPPGVRSGRAIWFLQEQDDTRLAPSVDRFFTSLGQMYLHLIRLCKKHYTEERNVRVMGKYKQVEIMSLSQSDLEGEIDVFVEPGTLLSTYKSAQQDLIMDLWDRKIIQDPQRILRLLELGLDSDPSDLELAEKQALAENMEWMRGEPAQIVPQKWENHMVHKKTHDRFRNGPEWGEVSGEVRKVCNAHCFVHDRHIERAQQEMMQQAMAMQQLQQGGKGGSQSGGQTQGK